MFMVESCDLIAEHLTHRCGCYYSPSYLGVAYVSAMVAMAVPACDIHWS